MHDTLPDTRRAVEQSVAVEEKDLKSTKADASLYNEVPSYTGSMCHCGGFAFNTPHS